jgi:hypothetical protein
MPPLTLKQCTTLLKISKANKVLVVDLDLSGPQ